MELNKMTNKEKDTISTCILLFHEVDTSMDRIKSCNKRALSLSSNPKSINKEHPLYIYFHNWQGCFYEGMEYDTRIKLLDLMAYKIDNFSKENMLDGDEFIAHILSVWKDQLFFEPSELK